jgi:DNA-directed RNA polymerase specialized sigma24 family protein
MMVIFKHHTAHSNKVMTMTDTASVQNIDMVGNRERWFHDLYESIFPIVARFIAKRGGSFEDAKDIFHDSLVILYEKVNEGNFSPDVSEERYLIGIAKHLWLRKFKDDSQKVGLDDIEKNISIPDDYFDTTQNRLVSLLELTGRKCVELLRAFYYDHLSLKDIRSMFRFSTVHSASAQKYKCIEKLRNTVQERSMNYEDFA